jgi:hypothetical protein
MFIVTFIWGLVCRNAYQLFLKTFMTDASHIDPEYREKEAPRYWQMLPDADKAKHRRRLNDIKQKYIKDYEKFLKVRCVPALINRLLCHYHRDHNLSKY